MATTPPKRKERCSLSDEISRGLAEEVLCTSIRDGV